jgi:hypothetical protein
MASVNHGRPLRQEAPRSPALADISKLVHILLSGQERPLAVKPAGSNGTGGGIGRFFKRIGLKS